MSEETECEPAESGFHLAHVIEFDYQARNPHHKARIRPRLKGTPRLTFSHALTKVDAASDMRDPPCSLTHRSIQPT